MKCNYILTIGLFVFSQGVMADNNAEATATVSGEVIKSLTILGVTQQMLLPNIVLPDSNESTSVELTCPSTVTYGSNGGNPYAHGDINESSVHSSSENKNLGTGHEGKCAKLTVQGEGNYHYQVNTTIASNTLATGVTLSSFGCISDNNFTLRSFGIDNVSCGGKITVDPTASAGSYSGSFDVQVVYD